MKKLINESYEMGKAAFGKYNSAPFLNSEFMATVPNCNFGDDKGSKLRVKMYSAYIKGWTQENFKNKGK